MMDKMLKIGFKRGVIEMWYKIQENKWIFVPAGGEQIIFVEEREGRYIYHVEKNTEVKDPLLGDGESKGFTINFAESR